MVALAIAGCTFDPSGVGSGSDDASVADIDGNRSDDANVVDADLSMFAAWTTKRKLTIDNTGIGQLIDFAVLVVLDDTHITYGKANSDGSDLRFADLVGTVLAHEIEEWNPAGSSSVWVSVPTIANNATTDLWMYYGDTAATDPQRDSQVWDSNFVGVWHLADASDSTGNLTSVNQGATATNGFVGPAMSFGGAEYLDTGASAHLNEWTIEVWINPSSSPVVTQSSGPISRGRNYQMQWDCGSIEWCRSVNLRVPPTVSVIAFYGDASESTWNQVTGTYDGTTLRTYLNGAITNVQAASGPPLTETGTTKLGARVDLTGFYTGDVDEARISRIARSADYIAAHYRSTTDNYITFGPELAP